MGAVFLCYCDKDSSLAREVQAQFQRFAIPTTEDGPREGQVVVLLFSEATNEDETVIKEIQKSMDLGLRIYGLRTVSTFPRAEFDSSTRPTQWINAIVGNVDGHIGRLAGQVAGEPSLHVEVQEHVPFADEYATKPTFQVDEPPKPVVAPPPPISAPPPVLATPPIGYSVILQHHGPNPIDVIAQVRSMTGLGLMEARNLVEMAPVAITVVDTAETAETLRARLLRAGAFVTIQAPENAPPLPAQVDLLADLYDVRLLYVGQNKIETIKAIRQMTGWDLLASKNLVESVPQTIARVGHAEAQAMRQQLESVGASVGIIEASAATEPPMGLVQARTASGCATSVIMMGVLALIFVLAFAI